MPTDRLPLLLHPVQRVHVKPKALTSEHLSLSSSPRLRPEQKNDNFVGRVHDYKKKTLFPSVVNEPHNYICTSERTDLEILCSFAVRQCCACSVSFSDHHSQTLPERRRKLGEIPHLGQIDHVRIIYKSSTDHSHLTI